MENAPNTPFAGEVTQEPDLFSLVDLRLIEGEGVHYHWNPIVEFYNECHDGDGRFCSGPGAGLTGKSTLPDKDGSVAPRAPGPVPRGKNGGSLIDPHEGTETIDGVRGYDKTGNFDKNGKPGKPVPGTDAWLEAHGIDKKTFNGRPYVKYEADRGDPALAEAYKDYPQADRFFKRSAEQDGQQGGYIMMKHEVPGSPYGPVPPQIRPNKDLITDQRIRAQKEASYNNAVARLEILKETTGPVLIRERKERVKQAELNLERIKTATPEIVRQEANDNLAKAHEAVTQAKESGSPLDVMAAKKNLVNVQRVHGKEMRRADRWDPEHELYDAETSVKWARGRLEKAQADPMAALASEIKTQESTVKRTKKAFQGASAKYVFAPGTSVARIETHPDPVNLKNLTEGKGRIYFAMEGSIKNDAILTALRREDPTAAVVNVPSVTLWQEKGGNAGEVKWFAGGYGKGREIVLIPDADGINNPNVMQQAKAMSAALKTFGAGSVILATPPLKPGTKYVIDKFNLPSGREEERKGIDDHLGAGRGTLGQLVFTKNVKTPSYDLSSLGKAEARAAGGVGINKNSIQNTEKALAAISSIVGPEGTSRITKNILAQASGLPATSAYEARERLKKLGIITVEHIFDEQALSRGKRIRNPNVSDERVAELKRRGIISEPRPDQLYTDANFDEAPVITIRDSRFLIKHSDVETGTLSDLSTWNPPKTFKGWTSPVTRKPDTTGIAARQVEAQAKTAAKTAANKSRTIQANKDADLRSYLERKVAAPGRRLVRTPEGARRYGVPIGSPIPIFALESNVSVAREPGLRDAKEPGLLEFYNSCHDDEGRFCPTGGSKSLTGRSGTGSKGTGSKGTGSKGTGSKGTGSKGTGSKGTGAEKEAEPEPSKTKDAVVKIIKAILDNAEYAAVDTPEQLEEVKPNPQTEFYNSCHDPEGKFCPTPGGSGSGGPVGRSTGGQSWPARDGRPVRTVAKAGLGKTVAIEPGSGAPPGISDVKAIYEVKTANGDSIRLFDQTGKAKKYSERMLNEYASLHEMYGLQPPRHITVVPDNTPPFNLRGTQAIAHYNFDPTKAHTVFNADYLGWEGKTPKGWTGPDQSNHAMPSANFGKVDQTPYTVVHEYGHHVDFNRNISKTADGAYSSKTSPLFDKPEFRAALSDYGRANNSEGYAEAFAEWHHTQGTTQNPAAVALAKYENWYGANGVRASAARGPETVRQASPSTGPDEGLTFIESADGKPRTLGNLVYETHSTDESEKADRIWADVQKGRARPETGFSMILGLVDPIELGTTPQGPSLKPVDRTEFYNSCHDEDGRFCPTGGGAGKNISGKLTGNSEWRPHTDGKASIEWTGSWPKSTGRPVAIIAQKRFGTVTMNGIKAKTVYEVTAANGNKVRLYDKTGKAGPYASDLLNNHARMNEMYPLTPPRNLIVSKFGVKDGNTFASVHHGDRATYVNANRLGYDVKNLRPGFQMPSSHTGNTTNHNYILTHEYGHHVDFELNVLRGVYTKHPLTYNTDFIKNMSRYGNGQGDNGLERVGTTDTYRSIESYAEAFGEWHHSNGTTRNPAAIALARWEGWYGTDKDTALAAAGSWEPADVEAWYRPLVGDLLSFAVEEENADAMDAEDEDMEFELPDLGKGEIGVADDFEARESKIFGDFESQDSSADQIARAGAVMRAVLEEPQSNVQHD